MKDLAALLPARFPIRPSHAAESAAVVRTLIEARTIEALHDAVNQLARDWLGCSSGLLSWSVGSHALSGYGAEAAPRHYPGDHDQVTAPARLRASEGGGLAIMISLANGAALLELDYPGDGVQLQSALPLFNEFVDVLDLHLCYLVEISTLRSSLATTQRHEQLQRALYAIADLAYADLDMHDMLARVHAIIGELTHARNLFIVLYDDQRDAFRFVYYSDQADPEASREGPELQGADYPNSLTLALLRHGRSLMGSSATLRRQLDLPHDPRLGAESMDWLGVPMLEGERVRGAVVVQIYDGDHHYSESDRVLLAFVAQHILVAVTRKQAQDDLEREVQRRTRELAEANDVLRSEMLERERGQQLQDALFRIVELASVRGGLDQFYAGVHGVVAELLDARNFFIALLSEAGDLLEFPYFVDERDARLTSRYLTNGITEYVVRTRAPLLAHAAQIRALIDAGEMVMFGTLPECWLGVPLLLEERCLGVMVVQSYVPEQGYTLRDQEILAFASYHIATALERKQAQDRLQSAYGELELRVQERTRELKHANDELHSQIAVRERIESRLKHEALHDSLTGLPNRASLLDRLATALQRYGLDNANLFAVLFLDLDRFKVVNDSVGHLVGDELLIEAGRRIGGCIREPDSVARLGGDEFTILLEDIHGVDDACRVAERVIASLVDPIRIGDKEIYTSASIGIAMADPRYGSAEELLRDADVAMYRAKSRGRQRYELFDQRLHEEALHMLDLESDLRRAITRHEFEPYFQPIVRLENGSVLGYEALLRWHHAERGLMLPGDFLALAEDAGSIEQIDWQLFEDVCRQLPRLAGERSYVGINVSARHFRSPHLAERLLQMLDAYKVPPQRIRIEITEGALLENPDQARLTMLRLRDAGVLTALDDFGTGYSSLSYLHRFPLHALKIDRSFVSDLRPDLNGNSAAVVRAIRALAGSLGMEVIAEGIESTAQREALLQLDCTVGQGFLFAHPQRMQDLAGNLH